MPNFVSTDLLQAARRSAKRKRAASACISCKEKKTKCSGFSPCTRCTNAAECVFETSRNKPAVIFGIESPAYPKDLNFINTIDSHSGIGRRMYPQYDLATSSDATAFHTAARGPIKFAADVQSAHLGNIRSNNGHGCAQRDSDAIYTFGVKSVGNDGRCDGSADSWICPPLAWLDVGSDDCP